MRVQPNNPVPRPGVRTPKLSEPTPVVVTDTPKLDAANSRKESIVAGSQPATRPLADAKHAPQAGFNNSEQL